MGGRCGQERIDALNAWNTEHEVEIAMDALRCPPGDADVSILSGGEKRRVALARLLLSAPGAFPRAGAPWQPGPTPHPSTSGAAQTC